MRDEREALREFLRQPCEAPNWLFGLMCLLLIFDGLKGLLGWLS